MKKFFILAVLVFAVILSFGVMPAYADTDLIDGKACCLIDFNTGKVLYEQHSDDQYPVASIVKLMTILLTTENIEKGNINLEDKVIASSTSAGMGGSQVFIEENGEYAIKDLLKSVIMASANDASVLLAETIAGSESNFVTLMNKRAEELGLTNTHYANSTGLPAAGQFSSAKDCAILLREVSKHDIYHNYSKIWMDTLSHPKGRETELVNTNKLIRYYKGCVGGKTGSTDEAGYCLSAVAKRGDMKLVGVVLGTKSSKDRFGQTSKLLDYGFNSYENKKIVAKGDKIDSQIKVKFGKESYINGIYEDDFYVISSKLDKSNIMTNIEVEQDLKAPIKAGDKIGTIYITRDGEVIGEVGILAEKDVESVTTFDNIIRISENFFI